VMFKEAFCLIFFSLEALLIPNSNKNDKFSLQKT
jgi:hypothetical protein